MEFTIPVADLKAGLADPARSVASSAAHPVLSCVLIVAGTKGITITGTDQSVTAIQRVFANIVESGEVAIPAKVLTSLLAKIPSGDVTFTSTDAGVCIKSDHVTSTLHVVDASNFPRPPAVVGTPVTIPGPALAAAADCVAHAVSQDTSRPILSGVNVTITDSELTMTATDSYRLATHSTPISAPDGTAISAIVPPAALARIAKISPETVTVTVSDSEIEMTAGLTTMRARLIAGDFPDTGRLLDMAGSSKVVLDTAELHTALQAVSPTADSTQQTVGIVAAEGVMTISSSNEFGDTTTSIDIDPDAEFKMSVKLSYFDAAVIAPGVEQVTMVHSDSPLKPFLIQDEAGATRCMVMPVNRA